MRRLCLPPRLSGTARITHSSLNGIWYDGNGKHEWLTKSLIVYMLSNLVVWKWCFIEVQNHVSLHWGREIRSRGWDCREMSYSEGQLILVIIQLIFLWTATVLRNRMFPLSSNPSTLSHPNQQKRGKNKLRFSRKNLYSYYCPLRLLNSTLYANYKYLPCFRRFWFGWWSHSDTLSHYVGFSLARRSRQFTANVWRATPCLVT